jgi:predicted transcriptional regulator
VRLPPAIVAQLRALAVIRHTSRARVLATALRLYERYLRSGR